MSLEQSAGAANAQDPATEKSKVESGFMQVIDVAVTTVASTSAIAKENSKDVEGQLSGFQQTVVDKTRVAVSEVAQTVPKIQEGVVEKTRAGVGQAVKTADQTFEAGGQYATEKGKKIEAGVTGAVHSTVEMGTTQTEAAREAAKGIEASLKETQQSVVDTTRMGVEATVNKSHEVVGGTLESVGDIATRAKDMAVEQATSYRQKANDLEAGLQSAISSTTETLKDKGDQLDTKLKALDNACGFSSFMNGINRSLQDTVKQANRTAQTGVDSFSSLLGPRAPGIKKAGGYAGAASHQHTATPQAQDSQSSQMTPQ
eukprot:gnl/MRDRNA2_/MRDRNA2_122265_c0_seq1.p1 gnl/MRDRNA2_/MRDRNA2_122265_c0~~gnl/MRDRNA2_/MRDRNA2_122265_c0_seq1.p1  ORF type:complete len:315 (-),score=85.78 gnl/MRDRNA2_/MRDRNA2_122265_c0_seq1:17-961(-)